MNWHSIIGQEQHLVNIMADLLLCIPLKNTTEVTFSHDTFKKLFRDDGDTLKTAVQELHKLRGQAFGKNVSKSQAALDLMNRYYDQIGALSKRLTSPTEIPNVVFDWEDALDKGSYFGGKTSCSSASLTFERICVLYNIASLQSQIGIESRRADSDEELKNAAKWFQTCAGITNHLAEENIAASVTGDQQVTLDLSSDALLAFSAILLAQAQEMFVTKAIKDGMKDSIIAKLCAQNQDMYSDAVGKMTKNTVKHLWNKTSLPIIAGKVAGYEGLSQYFQSQVCSEQKRIGEQIARLNLCLENLRKAQERMGNAEFMTSFLNEATRLVTSAQKDNDFIYHEPVPNAEALPTIDRVATARLAKLLPVPETFSTDFTDLFCNILLKGEKPPRPPPRTKAKPDKSDASTDSADAEDAEPEDSPTLSDIAKTTMSALGNYALGYLKGRKSK